MPETPSAKPTKVILEPMPFTGVLPRNAEEILLDNLVTVLAGCELIEDLVGASPTRFTRATTDTVWWLVQRVYGHDGHPEVTEWLKRKAWGAGYDDDQEPS